MRRCVPRGGPSRHGDVDTRIQGVQPGPLVNDYAALPGYHFAWVALMGAGLWTATSRRHIRLIAVTFNALMFWAIVVTGNHLFFDMALGPIAVAACWGSVRLVEAYASRKQPDERIADGRAARPI